MFFYSSMILICLITLCMFLHISVKFYYFECIQNIQNKGLKYGIIFIPVVFFLAYLWLDFFNGIIVMFSLVVFWSLCDLICYIIKKITKKQIKKFTKGVIVLLFNLVYFVYGYYAAHHVVQTNYVIETTKDIGIEKFRIAQISDSHVGATMDGNKFKEYMERINETNSDIVVVTGDFVDDDTTLDDMIKSCEGLGNLKTNYGVYFIYGNHDKGYFDYRNFTDERLRKELKKNNVIILEDEVVEITDKIYLVGRQDKTVKNRMSAEDLVKSLDHTKYIIDLNHQPNDYENEKNAGMDLVLSGHTHGGQFFPLGPLGTIVGFNDAYYGLEKRDNTYFIVNSGLGDWAIKFKTGTIAEYVIVDIVKK